MKNLTQLHFLSQLTFVLEDEDTDDMKPLVADLGDVDSFIWLLVKEIVQKMSFCVVLLGFSSCNHVLLVDDENEYFEF